jgi:hypothetical protein
MPRQARIDRVGALHHIICRGIERKEIFSDDKGRTWMVPSWFPEVRSFVCLQGKLTNLWAFPLSYSFTGSGSGPSCGHSSTE